MLIKKEIWQLSDIERHLLITQVGANKFVFHYKQGRAGVLKDIGLKNKGKTLKQVEKEFDMMVRQLQQQGYKSISQSTQAPLVAVQQAHSNQPNLLLKPLKVKAEFCTHINNPNFLHIFQQQLKMPMDFQFFGDHILEIEPLADNVDKKKVFDKTANQYYFYPLLVAITFLILSIVIYFYPLSSFFYVIALSMIIIPIVKYHTFIVRKTTDFIQTQTLEKCSQRHIYGVSGGILYYFVFALDYVDNYAKTKPLKMDKIYLFHADKVEKILNGILITEKNIEYELFLNAQNRDNLYQFIQEL